MATFLYLAAIIDFIIGMIITLAADSAIHQIYGAIVYLSSAVLFIGGAIVTAINRNSETLVHLKNQEAEFNAAQGK